jgi:hypothetical protein
MIRILIFSIGLILGAFHLNRYFDRLLRRLYDFLNKKYPIQGYTKYKFFEKR